MSEPLLPTADIEVITPEVADRYLRTNTANRALRPTAVKEYVAEMESGDWLLGCDAIGFDVNGVLINGQHRLNAVVKSGIASDFIVARNLPTKSKNALDVGKRRQLHERITIAGHKITVKEANICTLMLTPWSSNQVYKIKTHAQREQIVLLHQAFKPSITFVAEAAPNSLGADLTAAVFLAEHSSKEQVRDFLSLISTGVRCDGTTQPGDQAVRLYRDFRINLKAQGKRGADMHNLRMAVTAAEKFASESPVRVLRPYANNPFYEMEKLIETTISKEA
tara:strand:- start:796 stop:1632 length:837 start_codon:yes stop_codon:yes gene_type:complete